MKEISYWIRISTLPWQKATKEEYIEAERTAGFSPTSKSKQREPATSSFSFGALRGTITYNNESPE